MPDTLVVVYPWVEGCTRGGGMRVGWEGGYTGTQPDPPRTPYLVIFQVEEPTYGQMKAILVNSRG